MDSITVAVKFTNRELPRLYKVNGNDFDTIKDATKATGARFDGNNKRWNLTGKAALESLKAQFTVEPYDFGYNMRDNSVFMRASNELVVVFPVAPTPEQNKRIGELVARLQATYNKSDADLLDLSERIDKAARRMRNFDSSSVDAFLDTVLA
jgi:hypothetical protein